MVELAGGGGYRYPSASLFGPGKNPWNPDYWSGGSSSGSGAAVAAALVPFALGSETSGSILTPCAYCGVTGLRPTYGLVSRHGAMALSWTLDKIGPLCRSAEDCGLVLHEISGRDSEDPGSSGKSFYYLKDYGRPLAELRIGYAPADFNDHAHESARPAFQAALEVLRKLGPKMIEVSLPPMPYGDVISTIIVAEGATIFEPLIRSDKFDLMPDERQKAGLKAGLETPAKDYLNAMRIRRLVMEKINGLFTEVDVILSTSRPGPASGINEPLDRASLGPAAKAEAKSTQPPPPAGNSALIPAGNLAGLPALSLPCGFSTGTNLPLAVQLVARPFDEITLVALGREFQKQTDWHRKRPPVSQ
jgi:aspartyl-tRNA(Asn)/glutamyl-tRNA(Gln) amidotransferase subunit A